MAGAIGASAANADTTAGGDALAFDDGAGSAIGSGIVPSIVAMGCGSVVATVCGVACGVVFALATAVLVPRPVGPEGDAIPTFGSPWGGGSRGAGGIAFATRPSGEAGGVPGSTRGAGAFRPTTLRGAVPDCSCADRTAVAREAVLSGAVTAAIAFGAATCGCEVAAVAATSGADMVGKVIATVAAGTVVRRVGNDMGVGGDDPVVASTVSGGSRASAVVARSLIPDDESVVEAIGTRVVCSDVSWIMLSATGVGRPTAGGACAAGGSGMACVGGRVASAAVGTVTAGTLGSDAIVG